jgi:hypothetical protein
MFCLVYGFSNAATHDWSTPSTYGFLVAAVALLAVFAFWMSRSKFPLLPPRVVLDRNRGAAYLGILIVGAGQFGIFLFLTYYLQDSLGYSPVITGVAFLPLIAGVATASNLSNIVLMPRIGPKPIISTGLLLAAAGTAWITRIGPHSGYATDILGPIIVTGFGMGLMFSTAFNTGTYGVRPQDSGVASASVNTGQQLGGSIGTALLNTIAASATTSYLVANVHGKPTAALTQLALIHGYTTAFWWCVGIFVAGAVICGLLMRSGPLQGQGRTAPAQPAPAPATAEAPETAPASAPE